MNMQPINMVRRPPRWLAATAALALSAGLAGRAAAQPDERPGGMPVHAMLEDPLNRSVLLDQLEFHDSDDFRWDASGWVGHTFNRVTIRTEGERVAGATEHAEAQVLWTHAVARWWEVVAGARADFEPGPTQGWAAFGIQGLAPYRFELEATAFVGQGGDAAARFKSEYELLITTRLILQPRVELNWYGQADPGRGVGAGLSSVEAGLRLRYEFRREVAPYVGLVRERRFGDTADFARSAGLDTDDTSLVAGIRLRF
jgi:copper resistance protein B